MTSGANLMCFVGDLKSDWLAGTWTITELGITMKSLLLALLQLDFDLSCAIG